MSAEIQSIGADRKSWAKKMSFLSRMTVSRKILLVVFITTLTGLSLLVYMAMQNQRMAMGSLARSNNLTISTLMTEQLALALKWGKAEKIMEVYEDMDYRDDTTLAEAIAYDKDGIIVSAFRSDVLPNYGLRKFLQEHRAEVESAGLFSVITDSHHVILTKVVTEDGSEAGFASYAWSLAPLQAALARNLNYLLLLTGIALLGIMLLTGILMNYYIGRPLRRLTRTMRALAKGKEEITVEGLDRKDDVGDMSRAVQIFQANAEKVKALEIQRQKDEQEKATTEAQRRQDEIQRLEAEKQRELEAVAKADAERASFARTIAQKLDTTVNLVAQQIATATASMEEKAKKMVTSAADTDRHTTSIAAASEQAAGNVSGVASAAEQLAGSLQEIARQVDVSAKLSHDTMEVAESTDEVVSKLADTAGEIGNVIELINNIASQTNLLALNATIEAARAGEAGKGFAVVASEVKGLASQTTKATDEITRQIDDMQFATTEAVNAVKRIEDMIVKNNETVQAMAAALEEQSTATQEISVNVQQASTSTGEVSHSVLEVANMASTSGNSAMQLLESVGELNQFSAKLREEVDAVLKDICSMAS